jgi:hypothetical protein
VAFCELFLRRDIKSERGISVRKVVYCEVFRCCEVVAGEGDEEEITCGRRKDELL